MILVDSSVWIDFFSGRAVWQADYLAGQIRDGANIAINGIILTEVLQGIGNDLQHRRVRDHLKPLILLPIDETMFIEAADIYRRLRKLGKTIRKTNDCIIAATAIGHEAALLHNDRDFARIAETEALNTIQP